MGEEPKFANATPVLGEPGRGGAAGERCRSPGMLPAAGYEDVWKGSRRVCCSQLNLVGWIWAVFLNGQFLSTF